MIVQDLQAYRAIFPTWKTAMNQRSILIFSTVKEQIDLLNELFPGVPIVSSDRQRDDLNTGIDGKFDIAMAMNTLMYSPNPEIWFKNIFACCKEFWVQDVCYRWRSELRELGTDGDNARFCNGGPPRCESNNAAYCTATIKARNKCFDLSRYKDRMLDWHVYPAGPTQNDKNINFLARFKGDLW